MKKKLLIIITIFISIIMIGCSNGYESNNTKLNNLSYNKPKGKDEPEVVEKVDAKQKLYIIHKYEYEGYNIRLYYRQGESYDEEYFKNTELKYKDDTVDGIKCKSALDDDYYNYYYIPYKDDMYVIEFTGQNKTDEAKEEFKKLVDSIKFKK